MEIVIYCIAVIFLYYCIQISLLIYGISNVVPFVYKKHKVNTDVKFTLIIPFKNEANNLPDLLQSIANLNYNKLNYEVILVNDHSTDFSVNYINTWRFNNPYLQLTLLDNVVVSKSSKKDAISRAVTIAKFNWIMTTDADCILPENILQGYSAYLLENLNKEFLIGGVSISDTSSFLSTYQSLDFASLQAVTLGSFGIAETFMCNGANLVFSKNIFNAVDGYKGVNHIASGDDVFLLQKVLSHDCARVGYVLNTDCVVKTKPVKSWANLIIQRARWGRKSTAYQAPYPKVLGFITILANLGLLVLYFTLFLKQYVLISIILIGVKFIFDFVLLAYYNKLLKRVSLISFPISFLQYPLITVSVFIRLLCSNDNWKK